MEAKHTKGEWKIVYDNSDERSAGQWYEIGPAIIQFPYNCNDLERATAEADAKLISASKQLLKECIFSLKLLKELTADYNLPELAMINNLEKVIEKATK